MVTFGDSAAVDAGHWAFGAGNPTGPEKYFQAGQFTTGPSRDCYQELLTAFYIQATLKPHAEAYGGPLVNLRGEVVGMLSPRKPKPGPLTAAADYGIEFALPSNIIQGLYKSIKLKQSFESPWLGFAVMSRSEILKTKGVQHFSAMDKPRTGILIESVFDPGPGVAAGVKPGDWLVSFDGHRISAPVDFQKRLYLAGVGTQVTLEFYRDGEVFVVETAVEKRPGNAIQK